MQMRYVRVKCRRTELGSHSIGDYRKALNLWERLLKQLPAEDPGREHLKQAIDSAREKQRR